jgi:hypothetical protein
MHMPARLACFLLPILLVASAVNAKDKKKPSLPELVLRARTVLVVVRPDAGEPVDHPTANATARENVEKALMEWGRLEPVLDGQEADLVIAVRTGTGRIAGPTMKGGPIDTRPAVGQSTDSTIRVGAQQGHAPPLNDPSMGPRESGPRIGNEVGSSEDSFEVYLGNTQYPLDSSPVWRYVAKDCLRAPTISAVEEFRKAIVESEKPQQKKP